VSAEPQVDFGPVQTWPGAVQIDRKVIQLFALVGDAIAGATHSLLSGDRQAGKLIVERDADVDKLYREIEQLVESHLVNGADAPARLRYLITVLRLLPELERSGDLAEHVAARAARGMAAEMSARARGIVERMGEIAVLLWRMAADAYGDRTPEIAVRLDELDDEMDDLLVSLTAELSAGTMPIPVIIDGTLIGRFLERIGDHAVNLARRAPKRVRV
jgi:phosphate transport system protein